MIDISLIQGPTRQLIERAVCERVAGIFQQKPVHQVAGLGHRSGGANALDANGTGVHGERRNLARVGRWRVNGPGRDGFRPGRGPHDALDATWVGLMGKKVNWVLDADLRGFFDAICHGWLVKFLEHRIADRRVLRLIQKWLRAGVSEEGTWAKTEVGTPQGAVASPLLANIYLHYVFDLWVQHWRKHHATGDAIVVRYADDVVVGFEHRADAERFLQEWKDRMRKFGLELHPDKTRLIEFGRHAAENRKQRGEGKPETFDFLGFTHLCGKTRKTGRFSKPRPMGNVTVSRRSSNRICRTLGFCCRGDLISPRIDGPPPALSFPAFPRLAAARHVGLECLLQSPEWRDHLPCDPIRQRRRRHRAIRHLGSPRLRRPPWRMGL